MIVHDDGTSSNDDRLGAIGDMLFVIERGAARRRPARDRRRQPVRVQPRRLRRRSGGRRATASAVAVRDVGSLELASPVRRSSSSTTTTGSSTSRRSPPTRRPRSPPPRRTSSIASTRALIDGLPRRRARRRPARALRRLAPAARAGLRLPVRRRPGSTSANHEQLLEADNRLRVAAGLPARERLLARRSRRRQKWPFVAHFGHRHVTRSALAWSAWLLDLLLPSRCVACGVAADTLCPACLLELRPLGAAAAVRCCGAPTAWPVERCRECSGRRLAFASARAAVAYAGPARALVRAWKERGLRRVGRPRRRARRRARRAAGGRRHHVYPARRGPAAAARSPSGRAARRRARRGAGTLESAPLLARRATIARQTGPALARAAAERPRRVRCRAALSRARRARRRRLHDRCDRRPPRPRSLRAAARAPSRWSPSRGSCARLRGGNRPPPKEACNEASGEGKERGGQPVDPRVRRAQARRSCRSSWPSRRRSRSSSPSSATRRSRRATSPRRRSSRRARRCARARRHPT